MSNLIENIKKLCEAVRKEGIENTYDDYRFYCVFCNEEHSDKDRIQHNTNCAYLLAKEILQDIKKLEESSNGRILDFDSSDGGSIPPSSKCDKGGQNG